MWGVLRGPVLVPLCGWRWHEVANRSGKPIHCRQLLFSSHAYYATHIITKKNMCKYMQINAYTDILCFCLSGDIQNESRILMTHVMSHDSSGYGGDQEELRWPACRILRNPNRSGKNVFEKST